MVYSCSLLPFEKEYRAYAYAKLTFHAALTAYPLTPSILSPPPPLLISLFRNPEIRSLATHRRQPLLLFHVLEAVLALALPAHQIASERKDDRVDGDPGEENPEVETEPGM